MGWTIPTVDAFGNGGAPEVAAFETPPAARVAWLGDVHAPCRELVQLVGRDPQVDGRFLQRQDIVVVLGGRGDDDRRRRREPVGPHPLFGEGIE